MQSAASGGDGRAWPEATKEACPFCRDRLLKATPCFAPDFCKAGRIRSADGFIFPNLNPCSQYHAVATFSSQHFLDLDQFDEGLIAASLKGGRDYFRSVHAYDHAARFPVYIWNYLPPSAGSIIHPHVQLMVEREPVPELRLILESARHYYEASIPQYKLYYVRGQKSKRPLCSRLHRVVGVHLKSKLEEACLFLRGSQDLDAFDVEELSRVFDPVEEIHELSHVHTVKADLYTGSLYDHSIFRHKDAPRPT